MMSQLRDREIIFSLLNAGVRDSATLCEVTGRSRATVYRVIKRWEEEESAEHGIGAGRPPLLSQREGRLIAQALRRDPTLSARQLVAMLAEKGKKVSDWTVRDYMKRKGYVCSRPQRGPMIPDVNKVRRVDWCTQMQRQGMDWQTVVFADECQVQMHRNTLKLWRKRSSPQKAPVPAQSPRVSIWSAMSARGTFPLVFYEGTLDATGYCRVLDEGLLETAAILHPDGYSFVQDNAPCHSAVGTQNWLRDHHVTVLPWPSTSPDLNPIENLWATLKLAVEKRRPKTKAQLKEYLQQEWFNIPLETLGNLAVSMPRRLNLCIQARGHAIRY